MKEKISRKRHKANRQIKKLLSMVEDREIEIIKCEEKMAEARESLNKKEKGWSKARFQKTKMKYTDKIRGLRGTINRLEKQRLNIERREKEREEEETEELERTLAIELEEERQELKAKRAAKRKKLKKKKKTKKRVVVEKKVVKVLSKTEKKMHAFAKGFVKSYRSNIKKRFDKKEDQNSHEIVGRYPYHVTVVYTEPEEVEEGADEGGKKKKKVLKKGPRTEVILVFSSPKLDELEIDCVESKAFDIGEYKDIFRTVMVHVDNWKLSEAADLADTCVKKDLK